jgi:hypothetical protein
MAFGLGMVWPWLRRWLKLRPRTCFSVLLAFFAGLGILAAGYMVVKAFQSVMSLADAGIIRSILDLFPLFFGYSLYLLLSPVVGFLLGYWLVEKPPAPDDETPPAASWLDHTATAIGMGLAGLFPIWILLSFAFTLSVGMIPFTPALTGGSSDVTSIAEIIGPMVDLEASFATTGLAILTVISLILMGIFSFFSLPEPQ